MANESASYIPVDRRLAIAQGKKLPDRTHGAALFADISGFTRLTEALSNELGAQRGAEELSKHLNLIYGELIEWVDTYSGSVISFSGDAITCWFDQDRGRRATACALAMQEAMRRFATISTPSGEVYPIAIKVAVAAGPARRFLVGEPTIQYLDVLAGGTLDRLASAEHQAERGEVVVSEEVLNEFGDLLEIIEWRVDELGGRFAVVEGLKGEIARGAWQTIQEGALTEEKIRPWIIKPTYDRIVRGQEVFLSELRPLVVLFLSFRGIDYDNDPEAGRKLDAFIRWLQVTAFRFDGSLLQITFGDKGSYLYIIFGAPLAHEDDVDRAALTALQLHRLPDSLNYIEQVKIGISKGRMWVGPYGSTRRKTYGVLGDHTNLAARLMQNALPGKTLVSSDAQKDAGSGFTWENCPALQVKGKTDPITVFLLMNAVEGQSAYFTNPRYRHPIVGRQTELRDIEGKLDLANSGRGQILAITAEAGLGKSRMVSEVIQMASNRGFDICFGECASYGTNTSYLAWRSVWQTFFKLDLDVSPAEQVRELKSALSKFDPALNNRLPLLGNVLNLPIPENALTQSMDAQLRKASLEALLVDCLRIRARTKTVVIVLEDCHWLDPLSNDLLGAIGRAISNLPVFVTIAYRPLEMERLSAFDVANLPHTTVLQLTDLNPDEVQELIAHKLSEFDFSGEQIPAHLVDRISERAQGNPFYVEELVNYLHDMNLDIHDPKGLAKLELPSSLHSLILSRIDRLKESQKIILKAASIIGRLFKLSWLWGVDPDLGEAEVVLQDLDDLSCLDLTPLDQPEPVSSYFFKHIVTWEVAYESLPFATRAALHGRLGNFIEQSYHKEISQNVDLLAYHFDLSEEIEKKQIYLQRAGEAAQSKFANTAAIDYFRRLLKLLADHESPPVLFRLGKVYEIVGVLVESRKAFESALEIAGRMNDRKVQADCQGALGSLLRKQGEFQDATTWLTRAKEAYLELNDSAGVSNMLAEIGEVQRLQGDYGSAQLSFQESLENIKLIEEVDDKLHAQAAVLKSIGTLANQQGDPLRARQLYEQSLELQHLLENRIGVAILLNNLGMVAMFQEEYPSARPLFEESLAILREIGYRWAVGQLLNNLGLVLRYLGEIDPARKLLEESVDVRRALGDNWGVANSLSSLSNLLLHQGVFDGVREYLEESLKINAELGDRTAIAYCIEDFASLAAANGQPESALRLAGAAQAVREETGSPLPHGEQAALDRTLAPAREALDEASQAAALEAGQAMTLDAAIASALSR